MNAGERPTFERDDRVILADGRSIAFLDLGDPVGAPAMYFHGVPGSRLEGRLAARAPVSQWHGLADDIVPAAMAPARAAALPGSALHCLAGEGHLSLIVRRLDAALAACGSWA